MKESRSAMGEILICLYEVRHPARTNCLRGRKDFPFEEIHKILELLFLTFWIVFVMTDNVTINGNQLRGS